MDDVKVVAPMYVRTQEFIGASLSEPRIGQTASPAIYDLKPGSQSYDSATLTPVTHNQHRVFAG